MTRKGNMDFYNNVQAEVKSQLKPRSNKMTHELDTLSSLAEQVDDSGSLNLDCLGSNPNMSYCAFENTSRAIDQLTGGIEAAMEAIGINASTDRTEIQDDLILHALSLTSRPEKEAWAELADQASALAELLKSINPHFNFPTTSAAEAIEVRQREAQAEIETAESNAGVPEELIMPEAAKFVDLDVVAECYDGVGVEMARALWNRYNDEEGRSISEAAQNGFDAQREGASGNSVAANWETFNDAEKAELVAVFAAHHTYLEK